MRSTERIILTLAGLLLAGFLPCPARGQAPAGSTSPARPVGTVRPQTHAAPPASFVVLLDPAHGGSDAGATLKSGEPEKDATLRLAARLRSLLQARGIHTEMTRTANISMDTTARAVRANRSHAAACVVLHATSSGTGIHLFTSSLAPSHAAPRTFLPWPTAQAAYIPQSLRLASTFNESFASRHLPVLLERTFLKPLDNLACPAVAVEVAPLSATVPLDNPQYRDSVVEALAAALSSWRMNRREP
jgi:N-acetylmuramoyl-L-alanine amidase